jgi:hypothetical protein
MSNTPGDSETADAIHVKGGDNASSIVASDVFVVNIQDRVDGGNTTG